ncbi:type I secretion system permease/ATPase [Paracoccus aerodenitrificans]|uniref:type I secretion system permease/ATPase n=1 Tax=Paracoccus aerodenitrificans TaxID=3017781 RepID=UPI0022EFF3F6|nr:type I secretion system permease/ATPase [Paracoccus aerodenitrificans]WBU64345.1 type I secretion system permease/ATPase [Paracoccus aerodenitrificans]
MVFSPDNKGFAELRAAYGGSWGLLMSVAVFSLTVNILMLTGPLFMLQVYDRVLGSRSVETLVALFFLVIFLFAIMGMVDLARGRIMQRISLRVQQRLERRVFAATLEDGLATGSEAVARGGMRDLEAIRTAIASPVSLALFDLPFAPVYLVAVFIFHPMLGAVATAGGAILIAAAVANQFCGKRVQKRASIAAQSAERMSDMFRNEGELIGSLGMREASFARWSAKRLSAAQDALSAADTAQLFTVFSRVFRLFLQSAMLAAGAWLVLRQELTPGAMIAASIVMGRALQPVEIVIGQWGLVQRAQDSGKRLGALLSRHPPLPARIALPRPEAGLEISQLAVIPPGQRIPVLRGISMSLAPGQAIGVIGPSGSGKSSLARALTGSWGPAAGSIRLGGATLDQFPPDEVGRLIGYLPQRVTLFDGTVAENIARLENEPDPQRTVRAATAAAAHEMIMRLPRGYDTPLMQAGGQLSGGQMQRIGLARALYSEPVLLVLDEPNSNLDHEGSQALNLAIRQIKAQGGAVVIMAHRPAAIAECDLLLVLENGMIRNLGPRDEVLQSTVRNASEFRSVRTAGGAA